MNVQLSNVSIFGKLFKKFRLKSQFSSLSEFSKALADEGLIYEDSTLSRWQNGNRIPSDRGLLIMLIKIFVNRGGIVSLHEANILLESAGQGYLTESEIEKLSSRFVPAGRFQLAQEMVEFISAVGKPKRVPRTGWVREKIKHPESVAEHSFRVGVIAMVIAGTLGLDREKLMKMAFVRGLGEVVTRDIVVERGNMIDMQKRGEKENEEREGLRKVFKTIEEADEYVKIFNEMVERKSEEAKILWQIDKLEMTIQALEYEKEQDKNLDEFFINAKLQIEAPL
jgi:putative hydrolase of HD superfamily